MPKYENEDLVNCGQYWTTNGYNYPPSVCRSGYTSRELVWGGEGHYGYPNFPSNRDVGGSFMVVYQDFKPGSFDVGTIQGGTVYAEHRYTGSLYANTAIAPPLPSQVDGSLWGAKAYSRMKPDKPLMNGLTSLLELRDLPGQLQQRFHAKGLHEIGDYYLAEKFGWVPLLQDIYTLLNGQQKAEQMLQQFVKDEGKPVRRKIILDAQMSSPVVTNYGNDVFYHGDPAFVSYFYKKTGKTQVRSYNTSQVWASAQFRYWLPPGPRNIEWKAAQRRAIFGFRPTPSAVYKAIPWSWLSDWFLNYGDVLSNLSMSIVDRLAADYFYVMRHDASVVEATTEATFYRVDTLEDVHALATSKRQSGCKSRLHGDPYGLATQQNTLNGTQLAILGALGLSKVR
jgi:hypothetical protein